MGVFTKEKSVTKDDSKKLAVELKGYSTFKFAQINFNYIASLPVCHFFLTIRNIFVSFNYQLQKFRAQFRQYLVGLCFLNYSARTYNLLA